jgi:hypothetical protein
MANYFAVKNKLREQGAILVPVLLFASMVTVGILILLQTQWVQKKVITDFKIYIEKRRKTQQQYEHLQSLPVEKLLHTKSIKLIQKCPANLHSDQDLSHYYFQESIRQDYIYKLSSFEKNDFISPKEKIFEYAGIKIGITEMPELNQYILYFNHIEENRCLFKAEFAKQPYFQLVGNPADSLYVQDGVGLYKITFNPLHFLDIKFLKKIDSSEEILATAPVITRDARGDGRVIKLATKDKLIFYHEPSEIKHPCLDSFDHYDFFDD